VAGELLSLEAVDFYVPRFEVEIDDKKLDPVTSKAILNVEVTEKIADGASSTLTIHDEFDMSAQKFKYLDDPLFDVGKQINIKMGYGNSLKDVFKGTITRIEPSFFTGDVPTFTIEAHAFSYNSLKRNSPAKKFKETKFSDVAKKIAQKTNLKSVVDETEEYKKPIQKNNDISCFKFLKDLAKEAKSLFFINRGTLYFIKMEDNREEILTLELGKDIINFRPNIKTTKLLTEVEVRWSNPDNPDKPIVSLVKAGDEGDIESGTKTGSQLAKEKVGGIRKVITCRAANSINHAKEIAETELRKANNTLIEGTGECLGMPQIRPGVKIGLKKVGNKFSGTYFVTGATHTINDSGYRTRFSVMRNSVNTDS
jgi:phage protein D